MAPKRSLACGTRQASRWLSINAGSRSGSSRFPTRAAQRASACTAPSSGSQAVAAMHSLLCSVQLRHLKSRWTLSGPKQGVQFCTWPKLLNGQLLLAALAERPRYLRRTGGAPRSERRWPAALGPAPARGSGRRTKSSSSTLQAATELGNQQGAAGEPGRLLWSLSPLQHLSAGQPACTAGAHSNPANFLAPTVPTPQPKAGCFLPGARRGSPSPAELWEQPGPDD